MLDNFIFSCNAIIPIFILIAFGYYLKEKNFIDSATIKNLNAIVFKFTLPAMLFLSVATGTIADNFDLPFMLWLIGVTIFTYLFAWILAEIFIKDKSRIGAFVQGAFRGNYSILGLSVIASILGDADTGKGVVVTAVILPIYNVLSIVVLSARNKSNLKESSLIKSTIINIIKNPMIIGVFLGLIFSLNSIRIPTIAFKSLDNLSSLTLPLALICIGGNIDFKNSFKDIKAALYATFLKEFLFPVLAISIGFFVFNIRGEELVITFVLSSTPTAVSSYVMAANMDSDPELASNIILFTTIISLFTFTFGIYLLKTFNLI